MASINNNIPSLSGQRNLNQTQNLLNRTVNRLSTGFRINRAADDAAGLQISNNLRADVRILNQARRNVNDSYAVTQIADGALNESSNLLGRAAELATAASSGTLSDSAREALDQEFQQIVSSLDALGQDTNFNGESVFGGDFSAQAGDETVQDIDVSIENFDSSQVGVDGLSLTSEGGAEAALGQIQSAIENVSSRRGDLGAAQQRLTTTQNSLAVSVENIQGAESQIRDADVAEEVVNLTKFRILAQSGSSSLVQANLSKQNVLNLLQ